MEVTSQEVESLRPLLVTPEEAAEALRLSRRTVYLLMAGGQLESVKVGRSRRIAVTALSRYVDTLTGGAGLA